MLFDRVRDGRAQVKVALREALDTADVVVTNGGVSVGDYDYMKRVLDEMGAELRFWGVSQKPGRPLGFWLCRGKPVVGLPGYPVSAMVCFEVYVRPTIRKMMGANAIAVISEETARVTLGEPVELQLIDLPEGH